MVLLTNDAVGKLMYLEKSTSVCEFLGLANIFDTVCRTQMLQTLDDAGIRIQKKLLVTVYRNELS